MATTTEHLSGDPRADRESARAREGYRTPARETQAPARETQAPARETQPTAALLRRVVDELATLLTQEATLATSELSRSIDGLKSGIGSIASGGAVMFAGFLALLEAAIIALAKVLPGWLAAVIVGVVVLIIGYAMLSAGRRRADPSHLKPKWTAESLRRDKEMLNRRFP